MLALEGVRVSSITIQKILNENGLGTKVERWLALEQQNAEKAIEDAELIVVGTRARHGGERFAVGAVITRLLETARCPVLVAHPKDFSLMASTESPEPLCPNCARERANTHGAKLWCEFHARPEARAPAYGYSERYAQSGSTYEPVK